MSNARRLIASGIFLLAACSLTAQPPTRIYVYADWDSPQHSWIPIYCDGSLVAKLKAGKFFAINVAPGQHSLIIGEGVPEFVDVRAGRESFVSVGHVVQITAAGKSDIPALSLVPEQEAQVKIIHLVYIDSHKMYSPAVSREDPSLAWQPALKKRSSKE